MAGEFQMDGGELLMATDGKVRMDNCACCVGQGVPLSPYLPWDSTYAIPSTASDLSATFASYPLSTYYPPRLHRMCIRALIYCPLVRTAGAYATIPTPKVWRLAKCQPGTGVNIWQKPPPETWPECVPVAGPTGKPYEFPECDCADFNGGSIWLYEGALESEVGVGGVDAVPTAADLDHLWNVLPKCNVGDVDCCSWGDGVEHALHLMVGYVRWTIRDRATKTITAGGLSHCVVMAYRWIRGRCDMLGCS